MPPLNIDISNELATALENFDPVVFEAAFDSAAQILGFDKAVTRYDGERKSLRAVTYWIDPRTGATCELITIIKVDVYGTRHFKDYHHEGYFNGRLIADFIKKSLQKKELVESHELQKNNLFSQLFNSYRDNSTTHFEDLNYRTT